MLQRSITHQSLLKGFLATSLVIAGLVAGIRFAPDNAPVTTETTSVVEEAIEDIDLSGEWIGTTTEDYGDEARYDYRIVFEQSGNQLRGMLYLTRNHEQAIYTETLISGYVDGNDVFYGAEEILLIENALLSDLCLVDSTVEYNVVDGQEMLIGTWLGQDGQQIGCDTITGDVLLIRQPR